MSIIELNVGGTPYITTRETVCRITGTMLESMFNGTHASTKLGSAYFIDRDGEIFRHILQYLRDGDAWNPPLDLDRIHEILREARFYCIEPLIQRLEPIVNTLRSTDMMAELFFVTLDETALWTLSSSPDSIKALMGTFVPSQRNIRLQELLNRASREGYRLITTQVVPWGDNRIFLFFERRIHAP